MESILQTLRVRGGGHNGGAVHQSMLPFTSLLPVQVRIFWDSISSLSWMI